MQGKGSYSRLPHFRRNPNGYGCLVIPAARAGSRGRRPAFKAEQFETSPYLVSPNAGGSGNRRARAISGGRSTAWRQQSLMQL
jgi:hypothetical protein